MSDVRSFSVPPSPAKDKMLALLEEVRGEIESGQCVSLVIVPIKTERRFDVRSAGDISMTNLAGILGRCWMDAEEALKIHD